MGGEKLTEVKNIVYGMGSDQRTGLIKPSQCRNNVLGHMVLALLVLRLAGHTRGRRNLILADFIL
jgi:hypothetical protein